MRPNRLPTSRPLSSYRSLKTLRSYAISWFSDFTVIWHSKTSIRHFTAIVVIQLLLFSGLCIIRSYERRTQLIDISSRRSGLHPLTIWRHILIHPKRIPRFRLRIFTPLFSPSYIRAERYFPQVRRCPRILGSQFPPPPPVFSWKFRMILRSAVMRELGRYSLAPSGITL